MAKGAGKARLLGEMYDGKFRQTEASL